MTTSVGVYEFNPKDLIGHGAFAVVYKGRVKSVSTHKYQCCGPGSEFFSSRILYPDLDFLPISDPGVKRLRIRIRNTELSTGTVHMILDLSSFLFYPNLLV